MNATIEKFRTKEKSEPEWMYNLRKNSWHEYLETPLPDRVKHLWKYTDPNNFEVDARKIMSLETAQISSDTTLSNLPEGYSAFGYNDESLKTYAQLSEPLKNDGVILSDLYSAINDNQDLVGNHLGHLVGGNFGRFEAINLALWNCGLFLFIPDNTVIKEPIRLNRLISRDHMMFRLLIIAGANSEATIVDEYFDNDASVAHEANSVVEIFGGNGSNTKYANIQRLNDKSTLFLTQRTEIERDSRYFSTFGALGGKLSKLNAGTILNGKGADSRMHGIVFAGKEQHFDYHTLHHHKSGETYSNIDFKVALKDKAVSAYTGLIKIEKDALNCQAFQVNRNLLLNSGPKVESIPELEILCDQVQCSHGATMGPIDLEMIFYLKSRGFSEDEAVRTIVTGFVEPTLAPLPEDLKKLMQESVTKKLEGHI